MFSQSNLFALCWSYLRAFLFDCDAERERSDAIDATEAEVALGTTKKNRLASANANALKLSCELLKSFVSEAVQRAAIIAEAEGMEKIEATHLERILPQLLLDF
jgi:centromere protein X